MTKHRVLLCLVVVVLAAPAYAGGDPVGTVPPDHWAYDAVKELVDAGILIGYPDGTIRGNQPLTRYEFAMAISRLMDAIETPGGVGPQGPAGPAGPAGAQGPGSAASPATVVAAAPAAATAAASAASDKWYDRMSIDGYLQMRYEDFDFNDDMNGSAAGVVQPADADWGEHDGFTLPRLHVNLRADVNERTKAVVTWSRVGNRRSGRPMWTTDWTNIYLDYAPSDAWTVRVGQAPNWFGLEGAQDSSDRMALERAACLTTVPDGPSSIYKYGRWDRGVWFIRNRRSTGGPQAILGLTNGNYRDVEDNSHKTLTLDLKWERPWGQYGVSWLNGKMRSAKGDRKALLGYVRYAPPNQRWAVQAEYMDGKRWSSDLKGWYGQFEYQLTKNPTWVFVKLEDYERGDWMEYDAVHIGLTKQLDRNNELTLQLSDGDLKEEGHSAKRDEIGLQWQMMFE